MPGAPGRALASLYARVVEFRNRRFDAGRSVVTFDRPVISVGNLSLGGTGKTPMVERVVTVLRAHGRDPCIAMRGYKSGRSPRGLSDECELYRGAFDDLPVVAQANRVEGLIRLFASERGARVDCVVLDDGFQHRRISRQLDMVLLDGSHDVFGSGVFPAGTLREPAANIRRATHVGITHAELVGAEAIEALAARVHEAAPAARVCVTSHEWTGLSIAGPLGARETEVSWLSGKRVVVACGIGRPASFLSGIERAGAEPRVVMVLPDHDPFTPRTVERIARAARDGGAEAIVVTEKDWTKLGGRSGVAWPCPVVRPRLELAFRSGWEGLAVDLLATAAGAPA